MKNKLLISIIIFLIIGAVVFAFVFVTSDFKFSDFKLLGGDTNTYHEKTYTEKICEQMIRNNITEFHGWNSDCYFLDNQCICIREIP